MNYFYLLPWSTGDTIIAIFVLLFFLCCFIAVRLYIKWNEEEYDKQYKKKKG